MKRSPFSHYSFAQPIDPVQRVNVYDTNDPQKLLALKRLEAAAMLDVLRTLNRTELTINQLCLIGRNVLRAQLGVKKMAFYYLYQGSWHEGMRLGFRALPPEADLEMKQYTEVTPINAEDTPALHDCQVEYVVPISNRGEVTAYFLIADFADSEVEAQNDLIFIETLGNILAVAIQNRQLFQERIDQEFLKRELEVAETIQKQLLISDFSRFKGIDIYGVNQAHHRVGGDFYDVIQKGDGSMFFCIADVAGKGIGAALLMSNLQANLRSLTAQYDDLSTIVTELNRILYGITTGEKFVTLFLAKVNPGDRTLHYVNAGHNYPIFMGQEGPQRLDIGCILLGILPDITPNEAKMTYDTSDLLFMFTDGVVEQTNPAEEMFTSERVVAELLEIRKYSASKIVAHMQRALQAFAGSLPPTDDITMLCVKFSD